ncbi:META domain-containing protein [Pseudooctadecabacter sp.]|uniref:META domain-containing protein n=1 Tax=Pseudooctadecabacter sp. TaxID=1966338 RepID=UPI0025E9AAF5|nr:META domain-containing protein [Pseudooctadecabacter sp.]
MIKTAAFLIPLVALNACGTDETVSGYADPDATYHLIEMDGVTPVAPATIRFPEQGRVTGQGPCNAYMASQTVPYPWFNVDAIASTRRACPHLPQEAAYFRLLENMTLAEVTDTILILSDTEGRMLIFEAR